MVSRARDVMRGHRIHHLPVLDGVKLVGIVNAADLQALRGDLDTIAVESVMRDPLTVWGSARIDAVADYMREHETDCVVVLGGNGVQGVFTATDALRALRSSCASEPE